MLMAWFEWGDDRVWNFIKMSILNIIIFEIVCIANEKFIGVFLNIK